MNIEPYFVLEHSETVKPERFVVFVRKASGATERVIRIGKRGGFLTWNEAIEAATKLARFGTINV